ncbi:hypothetical protein PI91_13760 [Enterobacter sp. FB]|nr:hypothetical protein PI91_13760 [Enterobacter sp. FB]OIR49726.1 hypothetical protein BH716_13930 [Lelliottia nimipressuralis]
MIVFAQRHKPQLQIKRLGVRRCIKRQAGYPPATGLMFEGLDNPGRHAFAGGCGQGENRLQAMGIQIEVAGCRNIALFIFNHVKRVFNDHLPIAFGHQIGRPARNDLSVVTGCTAVTNRLIAYIPECFGFLWRGFS